MGRNAPAVVRLLDRPLRALDPRSAESVLTAPEVRPKGGWRGEEFGEGLFGKACKNSLQSVIGPDVEPRARFDTGLRGFPLRQRHSPACPEPAA